MLSPKTTPRRVAILLVDDRPDNLLVLEALLQRDDLEILTASSGREALEILLTRDIGLALLDVQMPEMDGFELAELMRGSERSRRIPIIFVTAGVHDAERVFEGYDLGAVDFLHKPVEPRVLANKVATFVELCRQRLELAETLRFHEMFVASIGHDLRSPLNVIAMVGQLLQQSVTDPSQVDITNRLVTATKRMVNMLDQLYDLSRARLTGGLATEGRVVDLLPTVRTVVEEQRLTSKAQVELVEEGPAKAYCDAPRMIQVVSNLVGNAIKHGKSGAPVTVSVKSGEHDVVVAVHNQGKIDDEVVQHIFDPFVSGPRPSKRRDGLGLGLFIVDQIVRAHGGSIELTTTEAEGTTFSVRIPRHKPA
jgi:two-component system sensor histidine kinase/response regulator